MYGKVMYITENSIYDDIALYAWKLGTFDQYVDSREDIAFISIWSAACPNKYHCTSYWKWLRADCYNIRMQQLTNTLFP
jgi:hypothetical protein